MTRCRTSVSIWFARATRCHLSTAISAFGSAARIPEAYGADGSITTISIAARNAGVCSASHLTQLPVRPGANPSSDPGPSAEQSTKLVSHGSDRFQVMPSRIQRTDRKRVSSMPSRVVGSGSGSHRAAAATKAAPSARTRGTRRRPQRPLDSPKRSLEQPAPAAAQLTRGRHRSRDLSERLLWAQPFTADQAALPPQQLNGLPRDRQILQPHPWPILHRAAEHPALGQGPSRAACSMITFTVAVSTRWNLEDANSCSRPNNTDVASDILVASLLDVVGDQQHVGATSPSVATTRVSKHPA